MISPAPALDPTRPVRLLVLVTGDPASPRAFSGSARSLVRALEARGALHAALDVAPWWTDPWAGGRLTRRLANTQLAGRLRWSALAHQATSRRAEQLAREHQGYDACLLYGTTFCPVGLGVPLYAYFDATLAQNARANAWETAWLGSRALQGIWERQRAVFEACRGLFPRSAWAAGTLGEDYGVDPAKVTVAGAGWNHQAEPPPHGPYDRRTVLFLGRDFPRKGGLRLLEAFRRTRAALPDARLVIVGCRPPGLEREPGVELIGGINKDSPGGLGRLLTLLAQTSLFCLPSHYEPFGVAVVEALRSGVPCLVPDRFAFPEMVPDGVVGRTFPADDERALGELMIELLRDPARLARMGAAAERHARERWSWDAAAARIVARVQADLLGEPRWRGPDQLGEGSASERISAIR